jgi:catechol 2,3-dioxygenase-like lactoylglutathione lyase family enzyme
MTTDRRIHRSISMLRQGLNFSHVGFFVHDIARMEDFYTRVLGFTVTDRGPLPGPNGPMTLVFLSRDPDEHHQVVLLTGRPATLPFNPINQISFKADSLQTLKAMHRRVQAEGADEIIPVTHGNAISVYVRDPEGNRLEMYIDTPWYADQPMRVPVDFNLDDDALLAAVEAHARTLPGFRPRAVWRAEMARRMGIET